MEYDWFDAVHVLCTACHANSSSTRVQNSKHFPPAYSTRDVHEILRPYAVEHRVRDQTLTLIHSPRNPRIQVAMPRERNTQPYCPNPTENFALPSLVRRLRKTSSIQIHVPAQDKTRDPSRRNRKEACVLKLVSMHAAICTVSTMLSEQAKKNASIPHNTSRQLIDIANAHVIHFP